MESKTIGEALKKRIADRGAVPVPVAVKGFPDKIEPAKAINGLTEKWAKNDKKRDESGE